MNTRLKGREAEQLACRYLEKLGYKILERNFLVRWGEIDIIAQDNDCLVFVEVKARSNYQYGSPREAITFIKQKALKQSALVYMQNKEWPDKPYRFDLVTVDYLKDPNNPSIELIKNVIEDDN